MKLKSLILGSVAAAGLSTAGYAADLGVLTSLDVCDALGLSGLTISSDTNCLQISGGVEYLFEWGDYRGNWPVAGGGIMGVRNVMDNDGVAPAELDWESQITAWLKFVGTADSDFGPASVVLKIRDIEEIRVQNEAVIATDDDTGGLQFQEMYVSVGDSTVLLAGRKGSVANFGDDEPFNFTGLFGSSWADSGVKWDILDGNLDVGGHVIQVVSDLGNGITAKAGLENLNDGLPVHAGTLVGVLEYAGDGITAHVTGLVGGILDGTVDNWALHAGFTGTFDNFKVRGAVAAQHNVALAATAWHAALTGQATFDIFTLALSGEALGQTGLNTDFGFGASIGATVTDGVTFNLGGRYFDDNNGGSDGYQIAAQLVAAVTETVKLTGEVGVNGNITAATTDFYGAAELAWAPGGGFTSSIKGEAHQNGAYKVTFKAAKTFE
jgi:Porin subfamily.